MAEYLPYQPAQGSSSLPHGGGVLVIITASTFVAEALKRAFQEHKGLKETLASKGINEVRCTHRTEEAESAFGSGNIRLALIDTFLPGVPNGIAFLKRLRLIHKAKFPVIITSFDKGIASKERIFDYPEEHHPKKGHYFIALPCLLEDLQRKIQESRALEPHEYQAVIYHYCSPSKFVQEKRKVIQHDLQHLRGKTGEERDKYLQVLKKHVEELKKVLGEQYQEELKIVEEQFEPQALASRIDSAVNEIEKALIGIQKRLEGTEYEGHPENLGDR